MKIMSHQGIQPPEGFALAFLREHDGATQSELAGFLHLSPPRVSTILSSLEERGDAVRRPDEVDRRLTRVFITPEGTRRDEGQRAVLGEYVMRTVGALSESDRLEFERLLDVLAERTREVLRDPPGRKGSLA
jgi:DNA-binding MarR family transcriptional regulator